MSHHEDESGLQHLEDKIREELHKLGSHLHRAGEHEPAEIGPYYVTDAETQMVTSQGWQLLDLAKDLGMPV
ncbi:MAG TPA: hypothetical protein VID03_06890 [Acidimicrobiia bacterium]|jgi:hypothetical protein